ncbi:MAG TPA: sigma-70 family RNA polymerase sigma factor [Rhizomicrobium sp.]|nr:sigma-70 family RNA polymerase sigma factor [Rhizomicrobium sp.]
MDDRRQRFETLALPHMDAAYNLARWLSRSPVEADDIVQDAMLRAFRAFDGFRGGDIKAWLLTIVRNCWLSTIAGSRRRTHASLEDQELPATDASPEETAIQAGTQRRMDLLIAQLAPEFREVLILREMEDLSYREIAEITGTPIGTVMSRLARARTQLRESAKEFL